MRRSAYFAAAALAVASTAVMARRPAPDREVVVLDRADKLHKQETDSFMIVSGNVRFIKGGMIMDCDSAHFFPATESFDAFGNVKMQQGDTLFIYADELNYDAPARIANLYADNGKKVKMINRDVTLETDIFTYDLGIEVGYYKTGGVLYDAQNRLTSLEGEYMPQTKDANFFIDVNLFSHGKSDTLVIYSDSLFYNTTTHISVLHSPSEIINKRGTIYTSDGLYDTDLDTAALYSRSVVVSSNGRTLTADTIYYDRVSGLGECFGYMVMTDSARQASLEADYGFFNQATDSAYATGKLLIKEYSQGDTLYLHGKQINAYRVFDSVENKVDTFNVADIWPRVRFFRSDIQGICDSMRVTSADTTLRMYINPVLWSESRQIFGNIVELHMNDSTIDEARLPDYGFISQRVAEDYYDQIAGKQLVAGFEGGELKTLDISGNVEIILYPEEADSTFNKMVSAESSTLTARFAGQTTEYIRMWPETTGKATPLFLLRRSMLFLPKFKTFNGVRPVSPTDVMTVPPEMDALMKENDGRPKPDTKR